MPFEIDTGAPPQQGAVAFVADWLRDQCPSHYTDAQIVQAYAHHVMGDMKRPAKLATVIDHVLFNWRFIGELGRENPDLFKEIWTAFYERMHDQ